MTARQNIKDAAKKWAHVLDLGAGYFAGWVMGALGAPSQAAIEAVSPNAVRQFDKTVKEYNDKWTPSNGKDAFGQALVNTSHFGAEAIRGSQGRIRDAAYAKLQELKQYVKDNPRQSMPGVRQKIIDLGQKLGWMFDKSKPIGSNAKEAQHTPAPQISKQHLDLYDKLKNYKKVLPPYLWFDREDTRETPSYAHQSLNTF